MGIPMGPAHGHILGYLYGYVLGSIHGYMDLATSRDLSIAMQLEV